MGQPLIVVTDGDGRAVQAVRAAARALGLRTLSLTAGSPSWLTAEGVAALARQAPRERPLVAFVDDHGDPGLGLGEAVLADLCRRPELTVIGVLAVAGARGSGPAVPVSASVCRHGAWVPGAVDKGGRATGERLLRGDTVGVLNGLGVPVVGIGDPGKGGAPVWAVRRALEGLLSGWEAGRDEG